MKFSNYLKTDFYKLKKSNWLWLMPIIIFGIMLLLYVLFLALVIIAKRGDVEVDPTNTIPLDGDILGKYLMFTAPSESNLPIILMVASAIFVCAEFKSGMTKIRLSRGANRVNMFFSKFIVMAGVAAVYTIGAYVLSTLFSAIFFGIKGFSAQEVGYFFRGIAISLYVNISIVSIYMMVAYLVRNLGGAIGACIGVYILGSVISSAGLLFSDGIAREIFNCLPSSLLTLAGSTGELSSANIIEIILVPFVFILVCNIVSVFTFRDRDVK